MKTKVKLLKLQLKRKALRAKHEAKARSNVVLSVLLPSSDAPSSIEAWLHSPVLQTAAALTNQPPDLLRDPPVTAQRAPKQFAKP